MFETKLSDVLFPKEKGIGIFFRNRGILVSAVFVEDDLPQKWKQFAGSMWNIIQNQCYLRNDALAL